MKNLKTNNQQASVLKESVRFPWKWMTENKLALINVKTGQLFHLGMTGQSVGKEYMGKRALQRQERFLMMKTLRWLTRLWVLVWLLSLGMSLGLLVAGLTIEALFMTVVHLTSAMVVVVLSGLSEKVSQPWNGK